MHLGFIVAFHDYYSNALLLSLCILLIVVLVLLFILDFVGQGTGALGISAPCMSQLREYAAADYSFSPPGRHHLYVPGERTILIKLSSRSNFP